MNDEQKRAPILEGLQAYHRAHITPFTIPAHKMGKSVDEEARNILGEDVYRNNIYLYSGIDDRLESHNRITDALDLAAKAFGSEQAFYSVEGTSFSSHMALLSVVAPGDEIIVARNFHISLVGGLLLSGAKPMYLRPELNVATETIHSVTPAAVEKALKEHPQAKAVFITAPDYFGGVADVKAIATIAHEHNVPLIVDEAWGGHFHFHPDYPLSAMRAGADISFASMHKTMSSLMQGGVINVQGKLVSREKLNLSFINYETTSINSLIFASCDASRRQMALHGKELYTNVLHLARYARAEIAQMPGLHVLETEILSVPGNIAIDPAKIFIDTTELGVSGFEAYDYLSKEKQLYLEVCTHRHIMPIITTADTKETVDLLLSGLRDMVKWARQGSHTGVPPLPPLQSIFTDSVMSPRDAFYAPTEMMRLVDAVGKVAAESVTPYPPGIPVLTPGERITSEIVTYISEGIKHGMYVSSVDETNQQVRVVKA